MQGSQFILILVIESCSIRLITTLFCMGYRFWNRGKVGVEVIRMMDKMWKLFSAGQPLLEQLELLLMRSFQCTKRLGGKRRKPHWH